MAKLTTTINSRKLNKKLTFTVPGRSYVYVDINGEPGTLGQQICDGGCFSGSTITYHGEDEKAFKKLCQNWLRSYIRHQESFYEN